MKQFLNKRWHSIPVALVSALLAIALMAGGAFAILATPQTITQEIYKPEYGSITAGDIVLTDLKVGKTYEKDWAEVGTVKVVVGADGAGKYLHMSLDEDSTSLYGRYAVRLEIGEDEFYFLEVYVGMGMAYPPTSEVPNWPDILEASIGPLDAGTYTFTQSVLAIAGDAEGTAKVKVTYELKNKA